MTRILVVYATTDGHTRRICEHIAARLGAASETVTLVPVEQSATVGLDGFDKVIVGASIRYGHHSPQLHRFVAASEAALNARPSAFFSVNLTARKPEKDRAETNPYVKKFLAGTRWRPRIADVFAGKLDYPRYGWLDRQIIRFIMLITHGPTDPRSVHEYTDWGRVDAFARAVAAL